MSGKRPSATPSRIGPLHLTKECSQFSEATPFCTITSSNFGAIPAGSTVVYANAGNPDGSMDSDLVVYTGGPSFAFGHVVLVAPGLSGSVTLSRNRRVQELRLGRLVLVQPLSKSAGRPPPPPTAGGRPGLAGGRPRVPLLP